MVGNGKTARSRSRGSEFSAIGFSAAQREAALLAPYAMHSADSGGRKHPEAEHPYRGPFQRDRDRITHSSAYRRLSNKTQVFMGEMGDYHRTRLTHTLEVASIARTLGRALRLNEDLIEALALAHDIGHPPFGHSGEDALNECLKDHGGFCHNRQALRIVEQLEHRYPEFPGLNLTHEVLAGQQTRAEKSARSGGALLEVQVVDAADSVAYDTHDADDALELKLLRLDELLEIPLWREAAARVRRRWTAIEGRTLERAVLHELIDWQVSDLLQQAGAELGDGRVASAADALAHGLISAGDEVVVICGSDRPHDGTKPVEEDVDGVPVFDTVEEAWEKAGPLDLSVLFVPAPLVKNAALEAIVA